MGKRLSVIELQKYKSKGKRISALTAYDYYSAKIIDSTCMDMILVGDSLGMVFQGKSTTIPVTLDQIIYHTKIVVESTQNPVIVADMPFGSFQISTEKAVENAFRILKETGCNAVKLEGGKIIVPVVEQLAASGVPVFGHLGLTPQSINKFGSYKLRAKHADEAVILKKDALLLQKAGVCGLILEKIPAELAKEVTESLEIPTIGIGAGPYCDGQILVITDMLGFDLDVNFRFVRKYADLNGIIKNAVENYIKDVENGSFPSKEESY
ncbi:MAG: 3-methyl-2-oxobutanoate hydroxymethyltransferase [Candidatus Delongbacteria bacterium]|nr:3-methyl-2-oxobutanoate hydroxymethyltransferase [Candidatus Delongbacteria bacterium]MCG2761028.1 3-methyl-2-oxobutanoate hydroxymethyltransferase [Candidatus Delongbacteria bacterium]